MQIRTPLGLALPPWPADEAPQSRGHDRPAGLSDVYQDEV
jgi:hypothetical protein